MPPATAVRRSSDITCCISVRPARNGISNQQYKQQSQQEVSNRYEHAVVADVVSVTAQAADGTHQQRGRGDGQAARGRGHAELPFSGVTQA